MERPRRLLAALALATTTLGALHLQPDPASAAPAAASAVVRPGAFCKAAEAGRIEVAADGRQMRCETTPADPRHRWRPVVK